MAVKIRLTRLGSKRNPFYRIVVADARSPRDGRIIEQLGTYNPAHVNAPEVKNRRRISFKNGYTTVLNQLIQFTISYLEKVF